MAKISVIIPMFNNAEYLRECLRSFCNQTFQDFEILCVDDGSRDDSFETAQSLADKDARIRLIRYREPVDPQTLDKPFEAWKLVNLGRCANLAVEQASGEYVMFPEADCSLRRDGLETMYRAASGERADILLADCFSFWDDLDLKKRGTGDRTVKRVRLSEKAEDYGTVFDMKARPELLMLGRFPQAGLFRREFLQYNNLKFSEITPGTFRYTGFFIRTMAAAERILAMDTPFYMNRVIRAARIQSMEELCTLNREYDEAFNTMLSRGELGKSLRPYYWTLKAEDCMAALLKARASIRSRYASYIAAELDRACDRGYLKPEICSGELYNDLQILMKAPEDYLTIKTVNPKDYAQHMRRSESYRIGAAAIKAKSAGTKAVQKGKSVLKKFRSRLGRPAEGDH